MSTQKKTRRLRGKYKITKNTFVICYLDVLEASSQGIRTFIGLSRRADTVVPIGTKIFFNAEPMQAQSQSQSFDLYSINVQQIEDVNGHPLLVCSPIQKETRPDLRSDERKMTEFPVTLSGQSQDTSFIAKNANSKGFTLHHVAKRAILSLVLNQVYQFSVEYKGTTYHLPGEIKHIHYDWKTHEHLVGVAFSQMSEQERTIVNLLADPTYTVPMAEKQTVDTALGKISDAD
jgi:hypothetical protein